MSLPFFLHYNYFFSSIMIVVAKARGDHIRVHYKHCREIARAVCGKNVNKAKAYLEVCTQ